MNAQIFDSLSVMTLIHLKLGAIATIFQVGTKHFKTNVTRLH